jgi:DNA-binding IscR family transcriptional regulator
MLTISKKSDYGLLFLTTLARQDSDQFIPLSAISKDQDLPYKFLSQIAIELKKEWFDRE